MQSELKPCPFCGCAMHISKQPTPGGYLGPDGDHAKGCIMDVDMHDYAECHRDLLVRDWNTRASDAEITRLTEALRAADEREKAGQPPIWPIGHGVVMVAHAIEQGTPLFFMRAIPDDLAGKPGDKSTHDVWHETSNAPTVTLAFADIGAIESHISALQALADDARQALAGAKP